MAWSIAGPAPASGSLPVIVPISPSMPSRAFSSLSQSLARSHIRSSSPVGQSSPTRIRNSQNTAGGTVILMSGKTPSAPTRQAGKDDEARKPNRRKRETGETANRQEHATDDERRAD